MQAGMTRMERGPLDDARSANAAALDLDISLTQREAVDSAYLRRCQNALAYLDGQNPHIGVDVVMSGCTTSLSIDEHEMMWTDVLVDNPLRGIRSSDKYAGYTMRNVTDLETGTSSYRVCHMLQGSNYAYFDDRGTYVERTEYSFFPVALSDYQVVHPLDAHSLQDLAKDPVTRVIDEVVFDETLRNTSHRLQMLGKKAGSLLGKDLVKGIDIDSLNHQRASYINGLDLWEDETFITNDFVTTQQGADGSVIAAVSEGTDYYELVPDLIVTSAAYRRRDDGNLRVCWFPDLYMKGQVAEGMSVLAPLRSIVAVK